MQQQKEALKAEDKSGANALFLNPADLYEGCLEIGVNYFMGVPDSLLKDFCGYVTDNVPKENHIIAANEGNAVAMATGYHLATGKHAMVYLQVLINVNVLHLYY